LRRTGVGVLPLVALISLSLAFSLFAAFFLPLSIFLARFITLEGDILGVGVAVLISGTGLGRATPGLLRGIGLALGLASTDAALLIALFIFFFLSVVESLGLGVLVLALGVLTLGGVLALGSILRAFVRVFFSPVKNGCVKISLNVGNSGTLGSLFVIRHPSCVYFPS